MKETVVELPTTNKFLLRGFRQFNQRYLKKNFHAVAANTDALADKRPAANDSFVLFANHSSWWDPLLAMYLCESQFPQHTMYAPIDAEAFTKYRIFGQMGFYPVQQNTRHGAADFLRISRTILETRGTSIWVTPEGRFADVRDRSCTLMPGITHLAAQLAKRSNTMDQGRRIWYIPAAIEYTYWEERLPEVLIYFGDPLLVESQDDRSDKKAWQIEITQRLRSTQDRLAALAIARDSEPFEILLSNTQGGTFFLYDWWRSLSSRFSSEKITMSHSDKLES